MNERIKELFEQAVIAVDVVYENNPLNEELAKMYIPDCFAEKFAELIVRECARIADVNQAENMNWNIGDILKEHFGVERV